MTIRFSLIPGLALGLAALTLASTGAGASGLALSCENGRSYPIVVRAVSNAGDLVTGYLQVAPRRTLHFRLVPMGTGYRYAGYGFWFDGVQGNAMLNVGKYPPVACELVAS